MGHLANCLANGIDTSAKPLMADLTELILQAIAVSCCGIILVPLLRKVLVLHTVVTSDSYMLIPAK